MFLVFGTFYISFHYFFCLDRCPSSPVPVDPDSPEPMVSSLSAPSPDPLPPPLPLPLNLTLSGDGQDVEDFFPVSCFWGKGLQ